MQRTISRAQIVKIRMSKWGGQVCSVKAGLCMHFRLLSLPSCHAHRPPHTLNTGTLNSKHATTTCCYQYTYTHASAFKSYRVKINDKNTYSHVHMQKWADSHIVLQLFCGERQREFCSSFITRSAFHVTSEFCRRFVTPTPWGCLSTHR